MDLLGCLDRSEVKDITSTSFVKSNLSIAFGCVVEHLVGVGQVSLRTVGLASRFNPKSNEAPSFESNFGENFINSLKPRLRSEPED